MASSSSAVKVVLFRAAMLSRMCFRGEESGGEARPARAKTRPAYKKKAADRIIGAGLKQYNDLIYRVVTLL